MTEATHTPDRKVKHKAEDSVLQIHEYNLDLKSNNLYLLEDQDYDSTDYSPGVEHRMCGRFLKNMGILMRRNTDPILIHMHTPGGNWEDGIAIYSAIKACPNPVTILNYSSASSMSSVIFCAADKRAMMPYSTFMFHSGNSQISGTPKQIQSHAKQDARVMAQMLEIYVDTVRGSPKFAGWTDNKIEKWLKGQMDSVEDVFLDAKETVEVGFADVVFGEDGTYDWTSLLQYP